MSQRKKESKHIQEDERIIKLVYQKRRVEYKSLDAEVGVVTFGLRRVGRYEKDKSGCAGDEDKASGTKPIYSFRLFREP